MEKKQRNCDDTEVQSFQPERENEVNTVELDLLKENEEETLEPSIHFK